MQITMTEKVKSLETRLAMMRTRYTKSMQLPMTKDRTHNQGQLLVYANENKGKRVVVCNVSEDRLPKEAHQWDEHYTTHDKHMGLSGHNTVQYWTCKVRCQEYGNAKQNRERMNNEAYRE